MAEPKDDLASLDDAWKELPAEPKARPASVLSKPVELGDIGDHDAEGPPFGQGHVRPAHGRVLECPDEQAPEQKRRVLADLTLGERPEHDAPAIHCLPRVEQSRSPDLGDREQGVTQNVLTGSVCKLSSPCWPSTYTPSRASMWMCTLSARFSRYGRIASGGQLSRGSRLRPYTEQMSRW